MNRTYEKRRAALARNPITLTDGSQLTASGYDSGIVSGLYWTGNYDQLATVLSVVERYGSASADEQQAVTDWFSYTPDASDNVFYSVLCQDTAGPSYDRVLADTSGFRRDAPLTGANWNADPCPFYSLPPVGSPIRGAQLPKLLMLNNREDPATPYANALDDIAHTPHAVLVTIKNEPDHTIYGDGDECADARVNAWLVQGVLPKGNVSCPGVPLPVPAALAASAASSSPAGTASSMNAGAWSRQFAASHGPGRTH